MKTTFNTKEEYLKMKENWSNYFNKEARSLERNEYGTKQRKLTATHFVLYAILRERDPFKALLTASDETISEIRSTICVAEKYQFKKWQKFFKITEEQTQKMIDIANEKIGEK